MTVYNPNIPQATDDPTLSQSDLLGNFGSLNTQFAVNHVSLTSGSNNGFHSKINFNGLQTSDPSNTGSQSALYPKLGVVGGTPQLFFNNSSTVYQLTGLTAVNGLITNITQAANGVVTVSNNHGLTTGNMVTINGVNGMTQVNGNTYTITVVTATTFQLNTNTTGFGAYTSGGFYTTASSTNFGLVTPWAVKMNFGSASGGTTTTVNLALPMPTTIYTAIVTPNTSANLSGAQSFSTVGGVTTMSVRQNTTGSFYYFVMGV